MNNYYCQWYCPENQWNFVAMVTYLNENQLNVQCYGVKDVDSQLFPNHTLTWSCLILLFVSGRQINLLSYQTYGIAKIS